MFLRLRNAAALITVEPTIFFYFLAIFLLFSVFHPLVFSKVCLAHLASLASEATNLTCATVGESKTSLGIAANAKINADTNFWIKVSSLSATLPSLLGDMMMGSWSDIFGRRLPLFLPSVGGLLATAIYISLVLVPSLPVSLLCLASLLSGIFGGYTGVIAASFAYISEVTDESTRSRRVSIAEGCIFLAATIGPFLSAALYSASGDLAVFIVHGLCHVANLLYCLRLPEPRSTKAEKPSVRKLISLSHFKDSLKTVAASRDGQRRTALISLLIAFFFFQTANNGEQDVLFLFLKDILGYPTAGSLFKTFYGFRNGLSAASLFLLLPLLKYFGASDYPLCLLGFVSTIIGLVTFAFSGSVPMVFISGLLGGVSKFSDTLLRSLISQLVPGDELGKVFGAVAVCGDLANMAGTLLANSLYSPLRAIQPGCAASNQGSCLAGLTHLGAALLVLLGFVLVLLAYWLVRREGGVEVEEVETRRTEDINNKDNVEEGGGEDNLGYKAGPDAEDK